MYILAGILRVAYAVRRELKDRRRREWYVRVGTSRHVAVALYTNSIMHARANINYRGFNIGRRRWPWPTTSWAKHVKRGKSPVNAIAILRFAREIPPRSDIKTMQIACIYFDKIMYRKILEKIISYEENHTLLYFKFQIIAISDLIFASVDFYPLKRNLQIESYNYFKSIHSC